MELPYGGLACECVGPMGCQYHGVLELSIREFETDMGMCHLKVGLPQFGVTYEGF